MLETPPRATCVFFLDYAFEHTYYIQVFRLNDTPHFYHTSVSSFLPTSTVKQSIATARCAARRQRFSLQIDGYMNAHYRVDDDYRIIEILMLRRHTFSPLSFAANASPTKVGRESKTDAGICSCYGDTPTLFIPFVGDKRSLLGEYYADAA